MELYQYFQLFHKIDQQTFDLLSSNFKSKAYHKGDYIIEEGQVQKELLFVNKGVQMCFLNKEGKQHVIAFTYPPNILTVPDSFIFQAPSKYFLQCLTDSEFDSISFDILQQLFDQSQQIERLFRKMTEAVLVGLIQRYMELKALTIEDRFKAFTLRSPQLLQLIPHKYIASYLDIDPTNFSKLFNSIKI